jgi:pyruvate dehydrogenase E2 component (dihydrolipoyllysine-residue acetyltransferase)
MRSDAPPNDHGGALAMAQPVHLPKVGMTMEEGTLCRWMVPDGDAVTRGQPIFEMETEKVQMEVEAEADGALKHLVAEGDVLKPGDVVGCLVAPGEEVPQSLLDRVASQAGAAMPSSAAGAGLAPASARPDALAGPAPSAPDGLLRISPIARRLADEHAIEVRALRGSGPDGRIVERDVQKAIEANAAQAPAATAMPQAAAASPQAPARQGPAAPAHPEVERRAPAGEVISYHGRRRTIGERMLSSLASMAQLTLSSETALDDALEMQHGLNREWRSDGVVVTLTALLVRACALALKAHPHLNAHIEGDRIVLDSDINIGIAVDDEQGLIVPVVNAADMLTLKQVAATIRELTAKVKEDKQRLEDVTGGTFTISSLEGSGVDVFTPIINPPQAAILGAGRVREVAAFDGPNIVRRQVTTLSLTFDHRVVDGAPAARFLDRVAELLSRPYLLM